jgi:hypothetical protein
MNEIEVGLSLVLAVCVASFKGSYLLRPVSIVLTNCGEKFQFLNKGILVTDSFGSVIREVRTDFCGMAM